MNLLNQFQLTDLICSCGQPTETQFKEIAAEGYECVINLAMPDHENSIPTEGSLVIALGMTYIHIPVPFDAPTEEHYQRFSQYMDVWQDSKVLVHCIVNARVSAFLFRYLQDARLFTPTEATTHVLEAWRPEMDDVWKDFVGNAPNQT